MSKNRKAIYGLRGKKDVSIFILYPKGRVSLVRIDTCSELQSIRPDLIENVSSDTVFRSQRFKRLK